MFHRLTLYLTFIRSKVSYNALCERQMLILEYATTGVTILFDSFLKINSWKAILIWHTAIKYSRPPVGCVIWPKLPFH